MGQDKPADDRRHGVIELLPSARRTALCCLLPLSSSSQLSMDTCRALDMLRIAGVLRIAVRPALAATARGERLKPTSGSWAVLACGRLLGCWTAAVGLSGPRNLPQMSGSARVRWPAARYLGCIEVRRAERSCGSLPDPLPLSASLSRRILVWVCPQAAKTQRGSLLPYASTRGRNVWAR